MGTVINSDEDLKKIFQSTQLSTGSHQKSAVKLQNLYNLVDPITFNQHLKKYLSVILFIDAKLKCPYTERTMEFIALTCYIVKQTFEESRKSDVVQENVIEHPFIENLITFLLETQQKMNFNVRFRSCQLINKILDRLVETELSVEFCDQIENAMLERLNDPKLEVRLEAILALHRFQDKQNPSDKIIDILKILMEQDRFAKVRRLCVQKISLRRDVVPVILSKIRDVDTEVRLAALKRLTSIPQGLKIEQRRIILKCGRLDTAKKIQTYIESTLLPNWLSYFNNNILQLMEAIRLDAEESDIAETNTLCEFISKTLFKSKSLGELLKVVEINSIDKVVPYEKLDWETCNYWRILVQFIRDHENFDEEINLILPELVHFCKYIEGFCESLPSIESTTDFLKNQFILKQLFTITKGYDISDPVSRSALHNLVGKVLSNVVLTLDTVKIIVSNLEPILPNIEVRARYINQLISGIQTPENIDDTIQQQVTYEEKVRAIKSNILCTTRDQEKAIVEKDYTLAGKLEEKLKEFSFIMDSLIAEKSSQEQLENIPMKKKDVATLVKCLDIALGLLLSTQVTEMTSSLETLKNETIFELMIHENETVQSKALHCYAVFSIIDKKVATDGIHIFSAPISGYQSGQECNIQILLTCIGAIIDLLRIYGTQLIAVPDDSIDLSESRMEEHKKNFFGGTSLTNIIQGLVDLMDDEQVEVQEAAGRGLCSLVANNIIQSSSLLSRLVLKWCNPFDESQKLKQMIGVTLQQLPYTTDFHKQWESAIIITLKAIIYAPDDSPLAQINPDDIAKFMLALYQINLEDDEVLLNFAMKVCSEIRKKPRAKQVHTFTKLLNMLTVSKDHPMIDDLLAMCDELRDVTNNRNVTNNLIKFVSKLIQKKQHGQRPVQSQQNQDESGGNEDEEETEEQENNISSDDMEED